MSAITPRATKPLRSTSDAPCHKPIPTKPEISIVQVGAAEGLRFDLTACACPTSKASPRPVRQSARPVAILTPRLYLFLYPRLLLLPVVEL
jgi:hypothetical protein